MFSKRLSDYLLYKKMSYEGDNDHWDSLEMSFLRQLILRIPQSKLKLLENVKIEIK